MARAVVTTAPLAFSYVRFSSAKQTLGDSLRRQVKLASDYAAKHGLTLDTQSFKDLGVSAFKGKNAEEGMLGAFLEAVDSGRVPKNSYLLVESLDRISRAQISDALPLFMSIVNRGVTLVTLADEPPQVYTRERINADNGMSLFGSMMVLLRAHNESAEKSRRVKAAYDAKRKRGEVITSKGPAWLTWNGQKWVVNREKAKVVNRIYDMAIAGHGQIQIMRTLEADGVPTMVSAKVWSQSVVGAILRNPAVYGQFTQKSGGNQVIEDYYAPIMSKEKFMTAQDAVRGRLSKGGIRKNVTNIFSGMCFCSECGTRLRFVPTRGDNAYLHCLTAYSNQAKCPGRHIPYKAAELAFVYLMTRRDGVDISGEFIEGQSAQEAALRGEIETLRERQKRALQLALMSPDVKLVSEELNRLEAQIAKLERDLAALNKVPLSRDEVDATRDLFDRYLKLKDDALFEHYLKDATLDREAALTELRRQLKVALPRQFKRFDFGWDKKKEEPVIHIERADGVRALVRVGKFLSEKAKTQRRRATSQSSAS